MTKAKMAVMFDLDGTLVDTETIQAQAESLLLLTFNIKISPEEISRKYAGIPTEKYIVEIAENRDSLSELMSKKNQIIREIITRKGIVPIAGMPELVMFLLLHKIPIYIASSSKNEWIQECLSAVFRLDGRTTSYGEYFSANYISGSEVVNPKPAPDIFLEAKKRMCKIHSELMDNNTKWIVVGDSMADMNSARAANFDALIFNVPQLDHINDEKCMVFSTPVELQEYLTKLILINNN
jgi:beta-phosphoglucomutase-like phosphatase (HAD superfamily)